MHSTLASLFNFKTQEENRYTVLNGQGPFEIRLQERMLCARMSLSGPYDDIVKIGSKYLQDYLDGNNLRVEKIENPGPSFQVMKDKSWELGIILPSSCTLTNVPKPINYMIRIAEIPAAKTGCLSFKGHQSLDIFIRRGEELKRWLDFTNMQVKGPLRIMKISTSPLPFLRNYEVQFDLF